MWANFVDPNCLFFTLEVDEDECDLIKAKYLAHMKELETHFSRLKDELISQRFKEVDQKLKEIEEESADEFRNPLKKLEMNMQFKTNFSSKCSFLCNESKINFSYVNKFIKKLKEIFKNKIKWL